MYPGKWIQYWGLHSSHVEDMYIESWKDILKNQSAS